MESMSKEFSPKGAQTATTLLAGLRGHSRDSVLHVPGVVDLPGGSHGFVVAGVAVIGGDEACREAWARQAPYVWGP
eukprot:scaffold148444_cov23-Tisochrysis_lutea.AAC.2